MRRLGIALASLWVGCSSAPGSDDAGGQDAQCAECDDGVFCNGSEQCSTGGCTPGTPPCPGDCDETTDSCGCTIEDVDTDGHLALGCGGDDCDDGDRGRHPGLSEVCDVDDVDEDCDPSTFGVRDADDDGYPDSRCCNTGVSGDACGDDCDDASASVHPAEAESCDGRDNDCDGTIDEEVGGLVWPDRDGDFYGDANATPAEGCARAGLADNGNDCDDSNSQRHPSATEACNAIDDDCDGMFEGFDEDDDRDGYPDVRCGGGDCNDDDPAIHPAARELCDGVDSNCIPEDEDVDSDGDGHAQSSATCETPLPIDDCDDEAAGVNPDQAETCDDVRGYVTDTDCDGVIDEGLPTIACYRDADQDLAGTGAVIAMACLCARAVSLSDRNDDCDDTDPNRSPAFAELCDIGPGGLIDTDCDGSIDEGVPTRTCYRDEDNDGYGLASDSRVLCSCLFPYTATSAGDCCDVDSNARPLRQAYFATPNACGSFDYNCDGQASSDATMSQLSDCMLITTCDPIACGSRSGWAGSIPSCGAVGTLDRCECAGAACAISSTTSEARRCR